MNDYSLMNLIQAYKANKTLCDAYLKGQSIEGMDDDSKKVLGLTLGIFLTVLIISLVLFIVALILLLKDWKVLPDWAKIVGIIGLLFFGPLGSIATIIIVLVSRK